MRTIQSALYLIAMGLLAGGVAFACYYWEPRVEDGNDAEAMVQATEAISTMEPVSPVSAAEVDRVWSKPIRRPIEDPPPPPTPPPPAPPPPPPPPLRVEIVGMVKEMGRPFALLDVETIGRQLVQEGDAFMAKGTEVTVLRIEEARVQLSMGHTELIVERRD